MTDTDTGREDLLHDLRATCLPGCAEAHPCLACRSLDALGTGDSIDRLRDLWVVRMGGEVVYKTWFSDDVDLFVCQLSSCGATIGHDFYGRTPFDAAALALAALTTGEWSSGHPTIDAAAGR